jgi:hypothetical protein
MNHFWQTGSSMAPDSSPPSSHNPTRGLPPVKPPSGKFILQMFLIPLLIVGGLVIVLIFGGLIPVGSSTPESFLTRLDNPNPDIRWRAAHELSQVLIRPESLELASDPDFALDLAERLQKALDSLEQAEYAAKNELGKVLDQIENDTTLSRDDKATRQDQAALAAWNKLRADRNFVLFLTSCVGEFTIPVGVHVLSSIAMKEKSAEMKGLSLRRRRAVWAFASLGNNMRQHYLGINADANTKVLTAQQKDAILEKLGKTAAATGDRAKMAHYAYDVLLQKEPAKVDVVMEFCAKSDDIYLRELVALALNFWDGDLVEPTLLMLSKDNGHGKWIAVTEVD